MMLEPSPNEAPFPAEQTRSGIYVWTPSARANAAGPPAAAIALFRARFLAFMNTNSSIALQASQAALHCEHKAALYNQAMSLGKRIRAARNRLRPEMTQAQLGEAFGITDKAVSAWERDTTSPELDKIAKLAKILKVTCAWLLSGTGAPPDPGSVEVQIDQLSAHERMMITTVLEALRKTPGQVA